VAGSSYYGISMNACIEKAEGQADEILSFLRSTGRLPSHENEPGRPT
jgi:hypothetical protein